MYFCSCRFHALSDQPTFLQTTVHLSSTSANIDLLSIFSLISTKSIDNHIHYYFLVVEINVVGYGILNFASLKQDCTYLEQKLFNDKMQPIASWIELMYKWILHFTLAVWWVGALHFSQDWMLLPKAWQQFTKWWIYQSAPTCPNNNMFKHKFVM